MLEQIIKQPAEVIDRALSFDAVVAAIGAVDVVSRGLVLGATMLVADAALDGGGVAVALSGGTDGERYLVTVAATTSAGEILERELEVAVVDGQWAMPDGGAPYLTIAEFVERFGLDEVVRMTDLAGSGRIDRGFLIAALADAQGQADLNLGMRYALPLDTVPMPIKTAIADIARGRLYPRGAPDGVADAAKAAVRLLERIASGAVNLPLPAGQTAASAESDAPVKFYAGRRAYPDALEDY